MRTVGVVALLDDGDVTGAADIDSSQPAVMIRGGSGIGGVGEPRREGGGVSVGKE